MRRISTRAERLNFQIAYTYDVKDGSAPTDPLRIMPTRSGELSALATLKQVHHVPVIKATHPGRTDDNDVFDKRAKPSAAMHAVKERINEIIRNNVGLEYTAALVYEARQGHLFLRRAKSRIKLLDKVQNL